MPYRAEGGGVFWCLPRQEFDASGSSSYVSFVLLVIPKYVFAVVFLPIVLTQTTFFHWK